MRNITTTQLYVPEQKMIGKNAKKARRFGRKTKKRYNNLLLPRDCNFTNYLLQVDTGSDINYTGTPEIEVSTNASAFAVFCNVRSSLLEKHIKSTTEVYRSSNCSSPPLDLSDTVDSDSDDEDRTSTVQSLPKVISLFIIG